MEGRVSRPTLAPVGILASGIFREVDARPRWLYSRPRYSRGLDWRIASLPTSLLIRRAWRVPVLVFFSALSFTYRAV